MVLRSTHNNNRPLLEMRGKGLIMKATDEQLIESFSRTQSYAATGLELGIRRQNIRSRVIELRNRGFKLPPLVKRYPISNSKRAKELNAIKKAKHESRK